MSDGYNQISQGAQLLLLWALTHNRTPIDTDKLSSYFVAGIFDVKKSGRVTQKKPETSLKVIKKDPQGERRKLLCTSGQIISIRYQHTSLGNYSEGQLLTNAMDVIDYVAVEFNRAFEKEIPEHSRVQFCGFFTELNDYHNSGAGTSHGVRVIGIFTQKTTQSIDD